MAKRKYFKIAKRRVGGKKKSYFKARGGYKDKFASGMRSSLQHRITRISHNALKSRLSQLKIKQRKSRFKAKSVNEYLLKLKKWGRYDTWASKQLISRLDTNKLNLINESGLIDMDKISSLNETQITNLNKAMNQFINSKTKTIQGINAVVRNKRQWLIEKSDNAQWVKSLTNREVEDLYRVFDEEEFENLSEKIKYETIWDTVVEANKKQWSEQEFIDELQLYTDPAYINDDNVLDSMSDIYNKFVNIK